MNWEVLAPRFFRVDRNADIFIHEVWASWLRQPELMSVYFWPAFVICKGINPSAQIWKKNLYCSASGTREEFVARPEHDTGS